MDCCMAMLQCLCVSNTLELVPGCKQKALHTKEDSSSGLTYKWARALLELDQLVSEDYTVQEWSQSLSTQLADSHYSANSYRTGSDI